jgi:hypothetical protein
MKPHDEITALALDYLNNRESIAEHVGNAFAEMPRPPLARLIDEFLEMSPKIDTAPLLRLIAETNQGRIEDLSIPAFRSYLVAKCSADEMRLRRAISALHNFYEFKVRKTEANEPMLIAARDEENSGSKTMTVSEFQRLMKNRTK